MGITDISLDSNKKMSSGDLANYNSNSTGSNVNTESSSNISNIIKQNDYRTKIKGKK